MAVIRNDVTEVKRILSQGPDSLAELNIYGHNSLHLAVAKPQMLTVLIRYAGLDLLNQRDNAGISVLEAAMVLSSKQCINGSKSDRCQQCTCSQCVEILLGAGCNIRIQEIKLPDSSLYLIDIFKTASESARCRYVLRMAELRKLSLYRCPPNLRAFPGVSLGRSDNDEVEDWSWIYDKITDLNIAMLFHRHGFRPHPSFFIHLGPWREFYIIDHAYTCWLAEHGVDLFLRSPIGPPIIENSSHIGLFGAHFAFYFLGFPRNIQYECVYSFNDLSITVERRGLTDGCICQCSTRGCSPFIWMMKSMMSRRWTYGEREPNPKIYAEHIICYYERSGLELTHWTYQAAIRYATFQALSLKHTCCDAESFMENKEEWTKRDDEDINEGQASLLELHEELVAEFEEKAPSFVKYEVNGKPFFPSFWSSYWIVRIEEELEKLNGRELTNEERQAAEEIGVKWHKPDEEREEKYENPYGSQTLEYYLHELDFICPEYREPWPEELHRVTELP